MTGSRCARNWIKLRLFLLPLVATGPAAVGQQLPPATPESATLPAFDFPGGTVGEYIHQLAGLRPGLNFVVSPGARELPLPPMSLKQVSPETAIQLLEAMGKTAKGGVTTSLVGQENSVWLIDVVEPSRMAFVHPGAPLTATQLGATPSDPDTVHVFSISLLMALQVKPETILTAVETALRMLPEAGGADGPAIKFHDESGLLMVRGSGDEIRIVQEVLTSIERGQSDPRRNTEAATQAASLRGALGLASSATTPPDGRVGAASPAGAAAAAGAAVIEALKTENQKLRMEIDLLRKKLESLQPVEKPSAPRDEKQSR